MGTEVKCLDFYHIHFSSASDTSSNNNFLEAITSIN